MNNIIYDEEIITPEDNTWDYYYNFIEKLDSRDCVKFSLFSAKIVNPNTKESNTCIDLIKKWLKDENSVSREELSDAAYVAYHVSYYAVNANVANATASYAAYTAASTAAYTATNAVYATLNYSHNFDVYSTSIINIIANTSMSNTAKINKYLQILLRKTKQFQNNKILEQISKVDVDKLELVDWNMITDIMQEEYDIVHEFDYEDIFSRRCLIELLRREYV